MFTWIVCRAVPDGVEPGDAFEVDITFLRALSTPSPAPEVPADASTGESETRQTPVEQSNTLQQNDSSHTVTITCPDGYGPFLAVESVEAFIDCTFGMSVIYRAVCMRHSISNCMLGVAAAVLREMKSRSMWVTLRYAPTHKRLHWTAQRVVLSQVRPNVDSKHPADLGGSRVCVTCLRLR